MSPFLTAGRLVLTERFFTMKKRSKAGQAVVRLIDRIFGLFLAAGIVFGIFGLTLEWILLKGPSPALRDSFVMTMIWTRRFDFIPIFF